MEPTNDGPQLLRPSRNSRMKMHNSFQVNGPGSCPFAAVHGRNRMRKYLANRRAFFFQASVIGVGLRPGGLGGRPMNKGMCGFERICCS